jgi:deoxyribodipyrimidine photolyase
MSNPPLFTWNISFQSSFSIKMHIFAAWVHGSTSFPIVNKFLALCKNISTTIAMNNAMMVMNSKV